MSLRKRWYKVNEQTNDLMSLINEAIKKEFEKMKTESNSLYELKRKSNDMAKTIAFRDKALGTYVMDEMKRLINKELEKTPVRSISPEEY